MNELNYYTFQKFDEKHGDSDLKFLSIVFQLFVRCEREHTISRIFDE
jgi:hypothetical protein